MTSLTAGVSSAVSVSIRCNSSSMPNVGRLFFLNGSIILAFVYLKTAQFRISFVTAEIKQKIKAAENISM